ncbi:hypothetical protein [Actinomycetospora cinnamomea]|uniref:Uncharacterized protein n=1 Tax=Actinomycetospora cinnamomea TaxID=663609 RepID=A0A2U1EVH0_9PSEU|nr:hypothetical protein [Actinomycetospora cinnamomea]PVZ03909.1 hypothetical protein C8D89_11918 [Actinomycetospora cinnamomea]
MSTDPGRSDEEALDAEVGMTRPEPTDDAAPDDTPQDVEPAFDIDLEPDEQGLAGAADEPTS